ncbi:ADP-ribose glycohydrolase MACROD2 isoform X1 [Nothobranchius furzeri]|uniref:Retinitis pigmentosa GTPase regulator b n=2 Tax=Nothobranchius furzeri TaxID=105023 RepID=A0A1A8U434_NOTFU
MSKKKKDWRTEKERLLQLPQEERRKEYRKETWLPLDKIPTWREDDRSTENEEEKEVAGGGGDGGEGRGGGGLSDKVSLYKGDITLLEVDAIVNAANTSLLGGGGVDGCIHKAAGSCLYDECHSLKGCETGQAKITCGYDLPARYVIHTVGPVARGHVGPTEETDLASCYQTSLNLVKENKLRSVAFPCISTGIYGYPNEPAAEVALKTVKDWIKENPDKITRVIFCVFLETDFTIYKKKMAAIFQDNDTEAGEEQPQGDNPPPSPKPTAQETSEDNKGKEETCNEEEGDEDGASKEDVWMESQNRDEDEAGEVQNEEEGNEVADDDEGDKDKKINEDKGEDDPNPNNEEVDMNDTSSDQQHDKEKAEPPSEPNDVGSVKADVEIEDESDTGTGEGGVENVAETSEGTDLSKTESSHPKDPAENTK